MNKYLNPKKYLNYINRKTKKICFLLKPENIKYQIDKARGWPNRKNFVQCVTFSRSGYYLLLNLLLKYFSNNLNYTDTNGPDTYRVCKEILSAGNFHYCADIRTNFQKNHDLGLKLKKNQNFKYVIQFRHCLPSIVS